MSDADRTDDANELLDQLRTLHEQNRERLRQGAPTDAALSTGLVEPDPMLQINLRAKAIYGVDNRQDICDVTDEGLVQRNVASTAALINRARMMRSAERWVMRTVRFGDAYRLCTGQTFEDQPIGPHCSGFLVAEDIIATAGHCVETEEDAKNTLFLFGFEVERDGCGVTSARVVFEDRDVYSGAELIGRVYTEEGADWALVRLDRPVEGREPLPVRREGKVADGHGVYVIGHPCGLPKKYAPASYVVDNRPPAHFEANLDTFGGNSGSPVFSAITHEVEGILVRGQTDFWMTAAGCQIASTFPNTGPAGESVCRTTELAPTLDDVLARAKKDHESGC